MKAAADLWTARRDLSLVKLGGVGIPRYRNVGLNFRRHACHFDGTPTKASSDGKSAQVVKRMRRRS
jgi:hypothetical protein